MSLKLQLLRIKRKIVVSYKYNSLAHVKIFTVYPGKYYDGVVRDQCYSKNGVRSGFGETT